MAEYVRLTAGDPAPWFRQRTAANQNFALDTVAGRYIALCFFASAANAHAAAAIEAVKQRTDIFNDVKASFFGVSVDPKDELQARIPDRPPGIRFFLDYNARVSALYGATPKDAGDVIGDVTCRQFWVILDPTLRVIAVIPFAETHVMEHGLYVLEGKAVYRLNQDWVEVEAGDFMWLRAFCPQACYAGGPGRFRYLLYKDVNRHPRLGGFGR